MCVHPDVYVSILTILIMLGWCHLRRLFVVLFLVFSDIKNIFGELCHQHLDLEVYFRVNVLQSPYRSILLGSINYEDDCQWRLATSIHGHKIYLRIRFPYGNSIYPDCDTRFVDIYDGPDTNFERLGRWCNRNSSLIISSESTVLINSHSPTYANFVFKVYYSLHAFNEPNHDTTSVTSTTEETLRPESHSSPVTTMMIVGISIIVFVCLVIVITVIRYGSYFERKAMQIHFSTDTDFDAYNIGGDTEEENPVHFDNPPDYQTVVSTGLPVDIECVSSDDQLPKYSDVVETSQFG